MRRRQIPQRLADFIGKFIDRIDHRLHLLMAVDHGAEHDVFWQFHRFRLDHQDRLAGSGDNEIELRGFQFSCRRIQDVFAVQISDPRGADGPVERNAGNGERSGGADHRGNVRIHFIVGRDDGRDDLNFVVKTFGEQRADGAVDQAGGQDFFFGGAAFTFEEAAGNLACSIGPFLIVDGERKEILAGLDLFSPDYRYQHHGIVHVYHNGAVRLTCDLAGFERQRMAPVADGFLGDVQEGSL